jgi:hypothetical protein
LLSKTESPPDRGVSTSLGSAPRGWRWGYRELAWALALLGIALRLEQYLHNRSLWMDEAMVGLNLIQRSLGQLTQPLAFHVTEPLLWLFTSKLCKVLFGGRELALRLPEMIAGVISLALVLALGRRLLSPAGVCIAVGWFALSRPLIYYSSELKPYGSDPAVSALLWLAALWVMAKPTRRRIALLALAGALAVWFSYPAVFVLSGLGFTILCWSLSAGGWRRLVPYVPALLLWGLSFAVYYWFFLRASSHDSMLLNNYRPLRVTLWHFAEVEKLLEMIFALQQSPFTILLGVAVFAFCVGCVYYWRQDRMLLSLLVTPLLFALLASSLHLYPAVGRFYNFFLPAMAVLIAAGSEVLMRQGQEHRVPVATVLVVLLFLPPVLSAREVMSHPMEAQEVRQVLTYVKAHQRPGDIWYVYWHTQIAYRYYADVYGLRGDNVLLSTSLDGIHREVFQQDAARLHGRRVWVIVANPGHMGGLDEFALLLQAFDAGGARLDTCWRTGAVAFLYQMKSP